ncbi:hypothetical protein LLH00_06655 [bacterium]|nr:hypothetical protein [bacterium]
MQNKIKQIVVAAVTLVLFLLTASRLTAAEAIFYGRISDPDGYSNVRERADGDSKVIGRIAEGETFLFEPSALFAWWKVYFQDMLDLRLRGFIHKSRIVQAKGTYSRIGDGYVANPQSVLKEIGSDLYPSSAELYEMSGGRLISSDGLIYDPSRDRWDRIVSPHPKNIPNTFCANGDRIVAWRWRGEIYVSADTGQTWRKTSDDGRVSIYPYKEGFLCLKYDPRIPLKEREVGCSGDLGATWNTMPLPGQAGLLKVCPDGTVYFGLSSYLQDNGCHGVSVSRDLGQSWIEIAPEVLGDRAVLTVDSYGGKYYAGTGEELFVVDGQGRLCGQYSRRTTSPFPMYINDLALAGGRLYLFDCTSIFIADPALTHLDTYTIHPSIHDWNKPLLRRSWPDKCAAGCVIGPEGEIYVSRKEGVFLSRDEGISFKQTGISNRRLPANALCQFQVGDTLLVGTGMGLAISRDRGRDFRTVTPQQGLTELNVCAVYGDGRGFIVAAGREYFAYSADGGQSFIAVAAPGLSTGGGDCINLLGRGPHAMLFSQGLPLHVLTHSGDEVLLRRTKETPDFSLAGDIDSSGKLIVYYRYVNQKRLFQLSREGLEGPWEDIAGYETRPNPKNPVHISSERAIYIACRDINAPKNPPYLDRLICSYDQGRSWLVKDFSEYGINMFGFDPDGTLTMRMKNDEYASGDFGNSWQRVREFN